MVIDNNFYMSLALREAWKYQGLTYPNPAVGACVVGKNGEILAVEAHQKAGKPHAEVNALQKAYAKLTNNDAILALKESSEIHNYLLQNHNNIFKDVTIYSTLEPCSHVGKTPSCANLIASLGVKNVYVGCNDSNKIAANGNNLLRQNGANVYEHILEKEALALLKPFLLWQEKNFVFFKWAQRLDGSVDNGIVSSKASRKHVHALRDRCDLLVIGGNTVRVDRPTLDARLVNGKAPDILILSNQKEFDRTIPLFNVKDRKVFIANNLEKVKEYKNVMIEGGAKMFEATKDIVDYYLAYVAPTFGGTLGFATNKKEYFSIVHSEQKEDLLLWLER